MKFRKEIVFIILLLSIIFIECSNNNSNLYIYVTNRVESRIVIDGLLDDNAWIKSEKVALKNNNTGDVITDSSMMTWVRVCYDEEKLYIAYECNDSDIWSEFSNRDDHLWEKDAVEIFIDTDGTLNTYYEIQVSPKNVLFDAHLEIPTKTNDDEIIAFDVDGIQTAVTVDGTLNMQEDTDKKWTVEISIPIADLTEEKASIDSGTWRINFFRMNYELKGERPELGWSPTLGDFHTPSKFGVLKFRK